MNMISEGGAPTVGGQTDHQPRPRNATYSQPSSTQGAVGALLGGFGRQGARCNHVHTQGPSRAGVGGDPGLPLPEGQQAPGVMRAEPCGRPRS